MPRIENQTLLRNEAEILAHRIGAFSRRCNREEYTDTGEAWALLNESRSLLKRLAK